MLLPSSVAVAMIVFGVLAIPLAGKLLAAKRAGAALLLWLIPVALTLPLADAALVAIDSFRPGFRYDAPGGPARLGLACLVLLPPVEILYQRICTRIAGGGPHVRARGTWGPDTIPTDSGDG